MRLLITGGAGFIGSNLAKLALANDVEVTILDDLSTGYRENIQDLDVAFIEGSILDVDAVRKSLVGVDSVIHLAALGSVPRSIEDPLASHAANATGTLTVLDEARQAGVKHFVVSSSGSVYGMNPALEFPRFDGHRVFMPRAVVRDGSVVRLPRGEVVQDRVPATRLCRWKKAKTSARACSLVAQMVVLFSASMNRKRLTWLFPSRRRPLLLPRSTVPARAQQPAGAVG